eukprot:596314-Amphidinium_carterae.3
MHNIASGGHPKLFGTIYAIWRWPWRKLAVAVPLGVCGAPTALPQVEDLETSVAFTKALALEPVATPVDPGGREAQQPGTVDCGEVEVAEMVGDPVRDALIAGQYLALAFAEEHAFVHQPMADGQGGAGAVPHQSGGLRRRELQEDVIDHIGKRLRHESFPAEEEPQGVQVHHHPANRQSATCDDRLPG